MSRAKVLMDGRKRGRSCIRSGLCSRRVGECISVAPRFDTPGRSQQAAGRARTRFMMNRMGTKKPTKATGKAPVKPAAVTRPRPLDEVLEEEMLVDASGTFRAVSSIAAAQVGHEEDDGRRFASESLVMQAQRDG